MLPLEESPICSLKAKDCENNSFSALLRTISIFQPEIDLDLISLVFLHRALLSLSLIKDLRKANEIVVK